MLDYNFFKKCFAYANKSKGIEISESDIKLAYSIAKEDIQNNEDFGEITRLVIKEVDVYGKLLDIKKWIDRVDYKYRGKTEVEKVYIYFLSKKTKGSLLHLVSTMAENPYDIGFEEVVKKEPVMKLLVEDYKNNIDFSKIVEKYKNPMIENKNKEEEKCLTFTPTIKNIGDENEIIIKRKTGTEEQS